MLFNSLFLSFAKFIQSYIFVHFFHFPLALSFFLVEAAEEVFEIIAGLFLFLVCNLGQKLSSTTAALLLLQWQMASIQVACLGLEMELTVPYFVSSPRAGNLVAHAMGC